MEDTEACVALAGEEWPKQGALPKSEYKEGPLKDFHGRATTYFQQLVITRANVKVSTCMNDLVCVSVSIWCVRMYV